MVMCQPGTTEVAKSKDTTLCTRQHQARGQARQQEVGLLVVLPVRGRAAPAEAQDGVERLAELAGGAVAHRGDVGHQAQVPEHQRRRRSRC